LVLMIIKFIMMMKGDELNALVENLQSSTQEEEAPAEREQVQEMPAGQQQQQPPQELQI